MKYTFDELNDSQKQALASKWCDNVAHFCNESYLVEYVLKQYYNDCFADLPFTPDDITNNERYGIITINEYQHELTESERDEKLELYGYLRDKWCNYHEKLQQLEQELLTDYLFNKTNNAYNKWLDLDSLCDELESMDFDEQKEIYQWFHCSRYACEQLEKAGQCTLDGSFWGRQCCGQSIELDYCIQQIAFNYYSEYNENYITGEKLESLNILEAV